VIEEGVALATHVSCLPGGHHHDDCDDVFFLLPLPSMLMVGGKGYCLLR